MDHVRYSDSLPANQKFDRENLFHTAYALKPRFTITGCGHTKNGLNFRYKSREEKS